MGSGPDAPGRRLVLRGALAAALLPLLGRLARLLRPAAAPAAPPPAPARHWRRLG